MTSTLRHTLTNKDLATKTATCSVCGPVSCHVQHKSDGTYGWRCKVAHNAYHREYKVGLRERNLAKFGMTVDPASIYNISPEGLQQLVDEQRGRCAICRRKQKLHVDHDHKTGKVRGLLCRSCNVGLGQFSDDPKRLEAAIKYLRRLRKPV